MKSTNRAGRRASARSLRRNTLTLSASVDVKTVEHAFVTILEKAGQDFEKGLAVVVKYLPAATVITGLLFPAAAAPMTEASVTASLIQNAIVTVEQKYAASGQQSGTGAQKAADVLTLVNGAVQTLLSSSTVAGELKSAGITVNDTYVQNLINAVVGFLNVQGVPAVANS